MLPIEKIKSEFLSAIDHHSLVVLSAPPGAGKSTGLPLWLLENIQKKSIKKTFLLQPRRVAAKNIACYLAEQLGEPVGKTVGYRLRNETKVSASCKIEVMTEGILTQLIQQDPELDGVGLVLFDEFHERAIHADLAFALARDVQLGLREDLTLVLMSATLDNQALTQQLVTNEDKLKFLSCEGRSYPVEISYAANKSNNRHFNSWREHALNVIKQTIDEHTGSILVFLPGVADIKHLASSLEGHLPASVVLTPLYGELSLSAQQQAIRPCTSPDKRKLVLATNIAETSLTIEGITVVVDSGLEKVAIYDSQSMTNRLQQVKTSKASAIQRAGRAGRLSAGHCVRLYSEEDFNRRMENPEVDIHQTDLQPVLIEAARWGVQSLSALPMLELPKPNKEALAWQELEQLNVVDPQHKLTSHGQQVANMPCHPRFAHMVITALQIEQEHQIPQLSLLACLLAALLEERDIYRRQKSANEAVISSDIHLRINLALNALINKNGKGVNKSAAVANIIKQTKVIANKIKTESGGEHLQTKLLWSNLPLDYIGELVALAYPERVAKNRDNRGNFIAINGKGLILDSQDAYIEQPYIVAAQTITLGQTTKIALASPVNIDILVNWQQVRITEKTVAEFDNKQEKITARKLWKIGNIIVKQQAISADLSEQDIANIWLEQLQLNGLDWLGLKDSHQQLLARWRWLNQFQPHLALPLADEQTLIAQAEIWFSPFVGKLTAIKQFQQLDLHSMLFTLLDYSQQQVFEQCAPKFFTGPTGRKCPISYGIETSPTVSLPLQEVYGQSSSPQVGDIKRHKGIALKLALLSPAGRPVQVTQDLTQFWQGSYREVQKEMKGRYPKHFWPDDPANAKPTNKTKRRMNQNS